MILLTFTRSRPVQAPIKMFTNNANHRKKDSISMKPFRKRNRKKSLNLAFNILKIRSDINR